MGKREEPLDTSSIEQIGHMIKSLEEKWKCGTNEMTNEKVERIAINVTELATLQKESLAQGTVNSSTVLELANLQKENTATSTLNTASVLEELVCSVRELSDLQRKNIAENSVDTSTILNLATAQKDNITASTVNTASIVELAISQKTVEAENSARFDLMLQKQDELSQMITSSLKKANPPPNDRKVEMAQLIVRGNNMESTTFQKESLDRRSENTPTLLELANPQSENFGMSTMNTASITELVNYQMKVTAEQSARLELIRKEQEELSRMLTTQSASFELTKEKVSLLLTTFFKEASVQLTNIEVSDSEYVQQNHKDNAITQLTSGSVNIITSLNNSFTSVLNSTQTDEEPQFTEAFSSDNINNETNEISFTSVPNNTRTVISGSAAQILIMEPKGENIFKQNTETLELKSEAQNEVLLKKVEAQSEDPMEEKNEAHRMVGRGD